MKTLVYWLTSDSNGGARVMEGTEEERERYYQKGSNQALQKIYGIIVKRPRGGRLSAKAIEEIFDDLGWREHLSRPRTRSRAGCYQDRDYLSNRSAKRGALA